MQTYQNQKDGNMNTKAKVLLCGVILSLAMSPHLMAKQSIEVMEIKLANLAIDISKHRVSLCEREEKLNELRLKALTAHSDKEAISIKLAEVESALTSDKLRLFKRTMKLQEMKVALLKAKNK